MEEIVLNTGILKKSKDPERVSDSLSSSSVSSPSSKRVLKRRNRLFPTRKLVQPNPYVQALQGPYKDWAFTEEEGPFIKGKWQSDIFQCPLGTSLDLEIGVGNGEHFAFYAKNHPHRSLVGIDLKYKPLVQSIRRALNGGCKNARVVRFNALDIQELFNPGELNHIFIYFSDPWVTPRKPKKRILSEDFLKQTTFLQKEGSSIQFKTDSEEYFFWAKENALKNKNYSLKKESLNLHDLHESEAEKENFVTTFERIFLKQRKPIFYLELERNQVF